MISTITAAAYLLKDVVAIISMLMIMRFIFLHEIKKSKLLYIIFSAVLAANSVIGIFFLKDSTEDYKAIMDAVSDIVYILALRLMTDCKKLSKCVWLFLIVIFTTDMFYSLLTPYIGDILAVECIVNIIIFSGVCILIYFTAHKSEINFLPKVLTEIPKWIYAVLLFFDLTCYYKEFGASYAWYNVLYIVSSVTVIVCVMYLVFKIFWLAHQQNLIVQQMAVQKDFGEQALKGDEELRKFRHDYKNHMIVVNAFLESGRTEDARRYLLTMNESINGVISRVRTGNFVADAILNNKSVSAAAKAVTIKFSGFIPPEGIANEDLCTILSNLVDNAIEAAQKVSGEKVVNVQANIKNGFFILSIINPTEGQTKTVNGKLVTTKQNKKNHGLGLKNVERALRKYSGVITTDIGDSAFSVDVRMKL